MNKLVKRLLTGTLAFATILTALPVTAVHASGNQYWTESAERVGYIEHVMNDGSIKSTFHEGHMKVEGETAYCVDINTNFKNGYKTRSDASTRMSSDQIADVALSLEYVKQYTATHTGLNNNQKYLLEQCVVWQRLSEQLGWQCDNVRASYNEISQAVQNEVYAGAKAFVKANKGRYECGGYIYTGEGQDIGQFWAKLNVGKAMISWVRLGNLQKGEQKKRLSNNPKPYFNFKMSLGVQSRYSHNFAKMEKSILVTLFLQ